MREALQAVIDYAAPSSVREVVASLGRTEDVRFSPNRQRLAIAAFTLHRVVVFDVTISSSAAGPRVALTRSTELSSPAIQKPHGLAFVDDDTILVCSRAGNVSLYQVPSVGGAEHAHHEVQPLKAWQVHAPVAFEGPSAVAVTPLDDETYEVLVCDNDTHAVTRHLLEWGATRRVRSSDVRLRKWMAIPDGVCVSRDRQWIAVSNHGTNDVLLFRASSQGDTDPDAVLRGAHFPHGLRFAEDDRVLVVADAEAPYIHLFAANADGWQGVHYPVRSLRVMDDAQFDRGHLARGDGGPKGLDLAEGANVLVTTCHHQPLAFYDLTATFQALPKATPRTEDHGRALMYELASMRERRLTALDVKRAEARIRSLKKARSYRLTKPLRRLIDGLDRVLSAR